MIVIADVIVPLVELQDENAYEYCAVDAVGVAVMFVEPTVSVVPLVE